MKKVTVNYEKLYNGGRLNVTAFYDVLYMGDGVSRGLRNIK